MGFSKKQIQDRFNSIIPIDYKAKKDSSGITYTKRLTNRILYLHLTYTGYPDMYRINEPMAGIGFHDVEQILKDAYEKILEKEIVIGETINYFRLKNEVIDYSKFNFFLKEDFEFNLVEPELRKSIEQGAYPFFERYDSLEKVYDETEKMDLKEVMKIICQPLPQRRLILKGLHNYKSYLEYFEKMIEVYSKSGKPNDLPLIYKIKELVDVKMGY